MTTTVSITSTPIAGGTDYKLAVGETLTTVDSWAQQYQLNLAESFHTTEAFLRKSNMAFSNLVINNNDLSLAAFTDLANNGKIVGYGRFNNFIAGDYTYQQAMFRAVLESINADRAQLTGMVVSVDVPDIFDRGTITIGSTQYATGAPVVFNRSFTTTPEVTLTLQGGSVVGIPQVITPTKNGFSAMLLNPSTGAGIGGTLTWAAHGY